MEQDIIQELLDKICEDRFTTEWKSLNFKLIPTTVINATIGSEIDFNSLYQLLLKSGYETIKRTKSGGISIHRNQRLYHHYVFDVKQYSSVIELTICKPVDYIMRTYRIQFRNNNIKNVDEEESLITGYKALAMFTNELKKDNINLYDYSVDKETGKQLNSEIHKPDNRLFSESYACRSRTFKACHLDFHKFYMSGLKLSHPEMGNAIERLNTLAKVTKDPMYKAALASTIGKFHSEAFGYRYANLAKDAINTSYNIYDEILKLLAKDRKILFTNTDGIWYEGEEWHGPYEGKELGQWENDYVNRELRIKSVGSYEHRDYTTKQDYKAVVKGRTRLDKIKSRDNWVWGDIFELAATQEVYTFKKGVGIVWQKLI